MPRIRWGRNARVGDRCWRGRVWPGAGLGALSLLRVISRDLAIAVVLAQERLAWALSWRTGESFKRGRRARRRSQSAARNWKAGWRAEAGGYFSNFEGTAGAGAEPVGLVARPGGVNVQLSRCGKLLVLRKTGCCRAPQLRTAGAARSAKARFWFVLVPFPSGD